MKAMGDADGDPLDALHFRTKKKSKISSSVPLAFPTDFGRENTGEQRDASYSASLPTAASQKKSSNKKRAPPLQRTQSLDDKVTRSPNKTILSPPRLRTSKSGELHRCGEKVVILDKIFPDEAAADPKSEQQKQSASLKAKVFAAMTQSPQAGFVTTEIPHSNFIRSLKDSLEKEDINNMVRVQRILLEQQKERHKQEVQRTEALVWKIVEAVHACVKMSGDKNVPVHPAISTLETEEMVAAATRFANAFQRFKKEMKPCHVDIGYQYYIHDTVTGINEPIVPLCVVSGVSGIYTGNDAFACYPYNEDDAQQKPLQSNKEIVGQMVARLKGKVQTSQRVGEARRTAQEEHNSVHTYLQQNNRSSIIILSKSEQCLPLIRFSPANDIVDMLANNAPGNLLLHDLHSRLQHILDDCFNDGVQTAVTRALPSEHFAFQPFTTTTSCI